MIVNELVPWKPGHVVSGMLDGTFPIGHRHVHRVWNMADTLAERVEGGEQAKIVVNLKHAARAAQAANGAIRRMIRGELNRN